MTIYEQLIELLKSRKGEIVTTAEVKRELKKKYGTKPSSVLLYDYCYNRINDGVKFDKHIFEFIDNGMYKYLGEDFPYTGKIYHNPQHQKLKDVGNWVNGRKHLYTSD